MEPLCDQGAVALTRLMAERTISPATSDSISSSIISNPISLTSTSVVSPE